MLIQCSLYFYAVIVSHRATLDLNLRHVNLEKKTTHDQHSREAREKDRELRNLKKAELQFKVAEDSLNHTQQIHEKVKGLVSQSSANHLTHQINESIVFCESTDLQNKLIDSLISLLLNLYISGLFLVFSMTRYWLCFK